MHAEKVKTTNGIHNQMCNKYNNSLNMIVYHRRAAIYALFGLVHTSDPRASHLLVIRAQDPQIK